MLFALCFWALIGGTCPEPGNSLGGRELRPPREGIHVGSLYYVRENPTSDLNTPANLEPLCVTKLSRWNISPSEPEVSADIDLTKEIEGSISLRGIRSQLISAGLSGNWADYYSYKLTNVKHTAISLNDMNIIYNNREFIAECPRWNENINKEKWAIYQIQAVYAGDIKIGISDEFSTNAELSAKLRAFEPEVRMAIKRAIGTSYSGKGLAAVFVPIRRN